MKIGVFADQIIEELGYTTPEKKLDRRNVIVRADAIRQKLIGQLFTGATLVTESSRIGIVKQHEVDDAYYISRTAPVLFDTVRAKHFARIPTGRISFSQNSGIRITRGAQDNTGGYFIEQKAGSGSAYGLLESAKLGGKIGFEVEGNVLWFNNMPPDTYPNVLITYIPSLIDLQEEDELPTEFPQTLMDEVKNSFILQKQLQQDLSNDNISE
jgi:hypothetical protein